MYVCVGGGGGRGHFPLGQVITTARVFRSAKREVLTSSEWWEKEEDAILKKAKV